MMNYVLKRGLIQNNMEIGELRKLLARQTYMYSAKKHNCLRSRYYEVRRCCSGSLGVVGKGGLWILLNQGSMSLLLFSVC